MLRRGYLAAAIALVAVACQSGPAAKAPPTGPSTRLLPACPTGHFSEELGRIAPPMKAPTPVSLYSSVQLDRTVEPGCVLAFHAKPGDETLLDVGRVIVRTRLRDGAATAWKEIGRGTLRVGRDRLALQATDRGGSESIYLVVEGRRFEVRFPGTEPESGELDPNGTERLPVPIDALMSALERCDGDERLLASPDGNVVEARRRGELLWRTRWLDPQGSLAVDTSVVCGEADARMLWRSIAGDALPMLLVASTRSERALLVEREPPYVGEETFP